MASLALSCNLPSKHSNGPHPAITWYSWLSEAYITCTSDSPAGTSQSSVPLEELGIDFCLIWTGAFDLASMGFLTPSLREEPTSSCLSCSTTGLNSSWLGSSRGRKDPLCDTGERCPLPWPVKLTRLRASMTAAMM